MFDAGQSGLVMLGVRLTDRDPEPVISRIQIPHRSTMPYRGVLSFVGKQGGIGQ
jgi:hypothetical protein